MAGRIPQSFIDRLLGQTDIVELIDSYVKLKKAGSNYSACCPFHGEKTPSFTVSPSKQFYHCFGCGAHGSAIGFLMEYEHLDFVEAIEALAERAHLEVEREESSTPGRSREESDLYGLLQQCSDYYRRQLRQNPAAISYLKQRGLSGETAVAFGIGYAPDGWHTLEQQFGMSQQQALLKSGMLIQNDSDQLYDRFRNRIMFPIHDYRGRVIGFGGRVLDNSTPKYLNSPETPLFRKGQELYGLYKARKSSKELRSLMIVEGYMDVVALAQHGIDNAVATLGTATTPEHLQRLFKAVPELIFCFDGDRAGRQAAWRALENSLSHLNDGREIKFLFLPQGEDPDSLVRKIGRDGFLSRLQQALPLAEYLLQNLQQQVDLNTIAGRAKLAELSKPHLGKLPDGFYKSLLQQRIAELVKLSEEQVSQQLQSQATPPESRPAAAKQGQSLSMTPIRTAIALLLQQPSLADELADTPPFLQQENPGPQLLLALLKIIRRSPEIHAAALLEHFRERPEEASLVRLAQWQPAQFSAEDNETETTEQTLYRQLFLDSLQSLQASYQQTRFAQLTQLNRPLTESEKAELRSLRRS